jgi:hypothetical protein
MLEQNKPLPTTTHWIQCQADANFVPLMPGDASITIIEEQPTPDLKPLKAMVATLPGMYVDTLIHWSQCGNKFTANGSMPLARLSGDRLKPCEWCRHIDAILRDGRICLDEVHGVYSDLFTPSEINDRLNMILLPRWCQDEVDAGKMPLDKAIAISHSKDPTRLWKSAPRLFIFQINMIVALENAKPNQLFSLAYGCGKTRVHEYMKGRDL